jgi:pimeloyl-ACP methyl ester carboxylesterase
MPPVSNPWEQSPSHSGFITLNTNHQLHATITGPLRLPTQPLVIIIPGLSASASEWAAVPRLASSFARVLLYSRSGYGLSSESSNPISAVSVATELHALLESADLKGPFIVVCHSWGGIIAREFLHLRRDDVAGMLFVDANQELNTTEDPWPEPYVRAMGKGLDSLSITGMRENHKLSAEEWQAFLEEEATEKHGRVAAAEFAGYRESGPVLAAKKQLEAESPLLGNKPLSVLAGRAVGDFEKIFREGLRVGNGTEEERMLFKRMLETYEIRDNGWQRATMRLSRNSRWNVAMNSGHNVQFTEPDVIVEELKWVLDNLLDEGQV